MTEHAEGRPIDDYLVGFGVLYGFREPAAQALLHMGELRLLTRWDDETLRRQLGCDPSRWGDAGSSRPDPDVIAHSVAFLRFASEVTQLVDLTSDRREVVKGAFELCHDAGGELSTRVSRVEKALKSSVDGDIAPRDLLEFGEIGRAWRSAALNLDSGPAHARAVAAASLVAPISSGAPHVSAERMVLLGRDNADELLGLEVSRRILKHLMQYKCAKCRHLAESVGLGAVLGKGSLIQSSEPHTRVAA